MTYTEKLSSRLAGGSLNSEVSNTMNAIAKGKAGNDRYFTPISCINHINRVIQDLKVIGENDIVYEPFAGDMRWYESYPWKNKKWSEIDLGRDFFKEDCSQVDWIITNPPYSLIGDVVKELVKVRKGFGLLLGSLNVGHARIKQINKAGFYIKAFLPIYVKGWFGTHCFTLWTKEETIKPYCEMPPEYPFISDEEIKKPKDYKPDEALIDKVKNLL